MRHSFAASVLHCNGIILLYYDGVTLFICDSECLFFMVCLP